MTVNTTNITSGPYVGNGASDTYSYTFRVDDKTQLSVYETDDAGTQTLLTVDTDYTVNSIGVDAGGTVVRVAGNLPTDYQWYIRSNRIENQLTAFASQGGFFPDVHEAQMDHITYLIQQLRDTLTRNFGISDTIDLDGTFTISDLAAARIGKILGFDDTGDLSVVTLNEDFISVYLGSKTADPTVDNQGGALIDGALYYNTTSTVVRVYDLGTTTWITINPSNAAVDISVADSGGYFTGTTVEAVLAEIWVWFTGLWTKLASTTNGEGASMVGVEDAAGNFTGSTVEAVLAELQGNAIVEEAVIPTTSGTAIDFTGIPNDVKRITITLNAVSVNGTAALFIRLGDSGGIETTGYVTRGWNLTLAAAFSTADAIQLAPSIALNNQHFGTVTLVRGDTSVNNWASESIISPPAEIAIGNATKDLSGVLDRVQLTTDTAATFNNGSIKIMYER